MDGVGALHADTEQLRVIASYTIAEHLLPRWLSEFHRAQPDVGTELRVANSTTVEREVRDGTADVGFVEGPQRARRPAHPRGRHRRARRRRRARPPVGPAPPPAARARRWRRPPLVVRETGSGTRETLDLVLGRHGLRAVAAGARARIDGRREVRRPRRRRPGRAQPAGRRGRAGRRAGSSPSTSRASRSCARCAPCGRARRVAVGRRRWRCCASSACPRPGRRGGSAGGSRPVR